MAVHVPLSTKAIEEAKTLMLPTNNLLKPADGGPVATPSSVRKLRLGAYYLTSEDTRLPVISDYFCRSEMKQFLPIKQESLKSDKKLKLELARKLLKQQLEEFFLMKFCRKILILLMKLQPHLLLKACLLKLIQLFPKNEWFKWLMILKILGFFGGTISGISFGIFDAKVYPGKAKVIEEADDKSF